MSSGEIISGVLLAGNKLFRVEELPVATGADFINHSRFQIHKYSSRNVFSRTCFAEERVERIVACAMLRLTAANNLTKNSVTNPNFKHKLTYDTHGFQGYIHRFRKRNNKSNQSIQIQ